MFRIFRKNKQKTGAVQDVQVRPIEQSDVDPLEQRLEDTRRQLGKRLGGLLAARRGQPFVALATAPDLGFGYGD